MVAHPYSASCDARTKFFSSRIALGPTPAPSFLCSQYRYHRSRRAVIRLAERLRVMLPVACAWLWQFGQSGARFPGSLYRSAGVRTSNGPKLTGADPDAKKYSSRTAAARVRVRWSAELGRSLLRKFDRSGRETVTRRVNKRNAPTDRRWLFAVMSLSQRSM